MAIASPIEVLPEGAEWEFWEFWLNSRLGVRSRCGETGLELLVGEVSHESPGEDHEALDKELKEALDCE